MKKNLLLAVTISCSLLCLYSYVGPKKIYYPEPSGKVTVEGDKLFLEDTLYAELRYFQGGKRSRYDGIAIYYYPYDKEEWINPKEGWGYYVVPENKKYGTVAEIEQLEREAKRKGYMRYCDIIKKDVFNPDKVICMRGNRRFRKQKKVPGIMIFNPRFSEDGKYVLYELKSIHEEHGVEKCYRVKYGDAFETRALSSEKKCLSKGR